jgi:hypothetical protein
MNITYEEFKEYTKNRNKTRIVVIRDNENKIIAAGTIFNSFTHRDQLSTIFG